MCVCALDIFNNSARVAEEIVFSKSPSVYEFLNFFSARVECVKRRFQR